MTMLDDPGCKLVYADLATVGSLQIFVHHRLKRRMFLARDESLVIRR